VLCIDLYRSVLGTISAYRNHHRELRELVTIEHWFYLLELVLFLVD
jgi:hypothetical protein